MLSAANRMRCAVVALLVVSVVVVGCGTAREVRLDASSDGDRIELDLGQVLVITLDSNPSTGFRWEVVEIDGAVLRQVGEAQFESSDRQDPPPPGTGGWETFRFEAVGAGETGLELVYRRPWEDVEPLTTFSVQVSVR
jgi:inhibitor of cysteine peptidase